MTGEGLGSGHFLGKSLTPFQFISKSYFIFVHPEQATPSLIRIASLINLRRKRRGFDFLTIILSFWPLLVSYLFKDFIFKQCLHPTQGSNLQLRDQESYPLVSEPARCPVGPF